MKRWTVTLALLGLFMLAIGCSGGGGSPVTPGPEGDTGLTGTRGTNAQTHTWGIFEVAVDTVNGTVEVTPLRHAMFSANVEMWVGTTNIAIDNMDIITDPGGAFIDITCDVTLTHPLPYEDYTGFDVRGIFMPDGNGQVNGFNTQEWGTDPFLRNPDGYTRWWNPGEFTTEGPLGYTPAALTTPKGFTDTGQVNPYKYFCEGLAYDDMDVYGFLQANAANRGYYLANTQNTRHYDMRFWGADPWVFFTYAVLASWEESDPIPPANVPDDFPNTANSDEAVACAVTITPSIFDDGTSSGGSLILDIDVWDWFWPSTASGDLLPEDVNLIIESSVLTAPYNGAVETGGGANYSSWHVEVVADNITGSTTEDWEEDFWVIVEYPNLDYNCAYSGFNPTDPLTAYFRYALYVNNEGYGVPPVVDSGVDGEAAPGSTDVKNYSVTAHDDDGDPLTYDWTVWDVGASAEVTTGITDNGDNIDIDWGAVGASDGDEYTIDCDVSDGIYTVPATQLAVTISALYFEGFDTDMGGWTQSDTWYYGHSGNCPGPPVTVWSGTSPYHDGAGALYHYYFNITNGNPYGDYVHTLQSPDITIPGGITTAVIRVWIAGRMCGYNITYNHANWKIAPAGTAFDTRGGAYAPVEVAMFGAASTAGAYNTNYGTCNMGTNFAGQWRWAGDLFFFGWGPCIIGGGHAVGSLTQFEDLVVPSSMFGSDVHIALQLAPDECGWPGYEITHVFLIDDVELIVTY